ncbi:MAG: dihydroorotase [Armatimonadetes bacterium]|nr:dihydroorotase [Armatimonadota bacterium]
MAFDLVIRGATVVTATGMHLADVAVSNGKVEGLGDFAQVDADEIVDARGLYLLPGAIDTQVHFREPGMEQKEDLASGSLAALCGGVTSFLEMPNTKPETTSPEALADKVTRASGRCWSNFGFFFGATPANAEHLAEYELLPGAPGVKIFVGSSTGDLLVDQEDDLRRVLMNGHKRVAVHSEDEARNRERKALISDIPHPREHPFLRDAESAKISTERLIRLCRETHRPVHILHISTADELPLIAEAKCQGLPITCEITPQHLWFSAPECYDRLGTKAQMNPPVRSEEHRAALWRALDSGLFDVFGSDHAPHTAEEKAKPYPSSPSGMPGVETILPVLLTYAAQGRISYETLVRMFCETPAALYQIESKGRIEIGYDADFVLVDPHRRWTVDQSLLHSKCGWSPYDGEELIGQVQAVYLAGSLAAFEQEPVGNPMGRCLQFGDH